MSKTQDKTRLKMMINHAMARHLDEHPEEAVLIAIGLASRLAKKMTLVELQAWDTRLRKDISYDSS